MKCIICDNKMNFYFKKKFTDFCLMQEVEYYKCSCCGFCASKTHYNMTSEEWNILNKKFHNYQHHRTDNPYNRNNRYFEQSLMIHLCIRNGLINEDKMLDWGSGPGLVSKILNQQFEHNLYCYDEYFQSEINPIQKKQMSIRNFDFVLNTGVFEHVTSRETLNNIENYVKSTNSGCFGVHTLVPENIPKDPNWMYLLPVHSSFHTNKSMNILLKQWKYKCSIYNPQAKLWVFFKNTPSIIEKKVKIINKIVGKDYLYFKEGFMDYWK
ncbi:hypothetical protein ACMC56_15605 [Campylobacterota bacterium DY0563]